MDLFCFIGYSFINAPTKGARSWFILVDSPLSEFIKLTLSLSIAKLLSDEDLRIQN